MKKNGFISTTLIYTFFILFITLMVFILGSYSQNRHLLNTLNDKIEEEFYELSLGDINLIFMISSSESGDYEISNSIPAGGYTFIPADSYCKNGTSVQDNIKYENGLITVISSHKETCYLAFRRSANEDIILRIFTKESELSEMVEVNDVPGSNYTLTSSSCTPAAEITFENGKFNINGVTEKTTCEVVFTKGV